MSETKNKNYQPSKTMLILCSTKELMVVQKKHPELLHSCFLLVSHIEVWMMLRSQGYDVKFRSEYFIEEDYKLIREQGRYLSKNWYSSIRNSLVYKDIDLAEMWRVENNFFFIEVVASNIGAKKIFEQEKPSEIIVIGKPKKICADKARYNGENDVFKEIAIGLAYQNGISVNIIGDKKNVKPFKTILSKSLLVNFIYRKVKRVVNYFQTRGQENLIKKNRISVSSEKHSILSYANFYDAQILNQVQEIIASMHNYEPVLVCDNLSTKFTYRPGVAEKKIPYLPRRYFEKVTYTEIRGIKMLANSAKDRFNANREEISRKMDYFLPHIQFDYFFDKFLMQACHTIEFGSQLFRQLKPKLFITDDMASGTQRILGNLARRSGVLTIGIPHGCIRDIEEYEFDTDVLFAWGSLNKNQFIKEYGYKDDRIFLTGSATMDKVRFNLKHLEAKCENDKSKKHVLILTGALTTEIFGKLNCTEYENAWKKLKEFISSYPDVNFVIKPHPYYDYFGWYEQFVKDSGMKNVRLAKEENLEELIVSSDSVILFQVISTAALIAMMAKKPVVFMKNAVSKNCSTPTDDWNYKNGILEILEAAETHKILNKVLTDVTYRNDVTEKEQDFLSKYIISDKKRTEDRINEAVNILLKERR
jgi:hypothetical protein